MFALFKFLAQACTMRSIVVSLITVGLVSAHTTSRSRLVTFRAWDLKVPCETESIATFVSRLPRGGDYGYNDNGRYQDDPDDRYSQQSYSNDYYEDEYRYGDDRGYDDRGGDPSVSFVVSPLSVSFLCKIEVSFICAFPYHLLFFGAIRVHPFLCQALSRLEIEKLDYLC